MPKLFLIRILIIISLVSICQCESKDSLPVAMFVTTKTGLRMYSLPSKENRVLTRLQYDEKVRVFEHTDLKLKIDGVDGEWVKADLGFMQGYWKRKIQYPKAGGTLIVLKVQKDKFAYNRSQKIMLRVLGTELLKWFTGNPGFSCESPDTILYYAHTGTILSKIPYWSGM